MRSASALVTNGATGARRAPSASSAVDMTNLTRASRSSAAIRLSSAGETGCRAVARSAHRGVRRSLVHRSAGRARSWRWCVYRLVLRMLVGHLGKFAKGLRVEWQESRQCIRTPLPLGGGNVQRGQVTRPADAPAARAAASISAANPPHCSRQLIALERRLVGECVPSHSCTIPPPSQCMLQSGGDLIP
eukprot:2847425-Prymnesium_polylepis.1